MPDKDREREEEEQEGRFKVSDRRRFSEEGEAKVEAPAEPAGAAAPVESSAQEPESPVAGDEPEKKRSLRERILGAKDKEKASEEQAHFPLPEMSFSTFILSLSQSVYIHLGEIPDPMSNEKRKDLLMAKQTIDILGIMDEKTKGNLTKEESNMLESILYDLRMRYVQETTR